MKKPLLIGIAAVLIGAFVAIQIMNRQSSDENWPEGQKITFLVPSEAGGSMDILVRQLIGYWEKELGTEIVVDNRPGASTLVGAELFLKAPDDGSTVFAGIQILLSSGAVLQNANFTMNDFDALNYQQFDPVSVTVPADSPYKTFEDLVADIKARPGQVKCGLIFGSAPYLAGKIISERLGLNYAEVMYDGGTGYRTALLGHHIDFLLSNANGDRALGDNARVLAISGNKRLPFYPDTPTFNEILKIDDFPAIGSGRLIMVHPSLRQKYPKRYEKLLSTYKKAFESPEYAAHRKQIGEDVISGFYGPDESNKMNREVHELLVKYKDSIQ